MKKNGVITLVFIITLFLYCTPAYCNLTLIQSEFYQDGGTRCVEYEKNVRVIKYCIDHRLTNGTNKVFRGGYPGQANAKIITAREMKSVYDDISELMNSAEYKKYSAMSRDEMKALIVIHDHQVDEQKMKEHRKASSYRLLERFKQDLSIRLKK